MNYSKKYVVILISLLFLSWGNGYAAELLRVYLTDSIRPVTHCASGALYGVTETIPADINNLVAPLKPKMYCQPPEGKNGNQHNFGDAFIVADRLKNTTATVQISFADLLPYWPYQYPGKEKWLSEIERLVKKKLNSGLTNIDSYVIWNEPNETWPAGVEDFCKNLWKPTYDLIRKLEPNAKIAGPAIAYYNPNWMKTFFTYCKENNCLPDLFCWHQWGAEGFIDAVTKARQLQADLGIDELPYCINEYSCSSDEDKRKFEGCPGYCVPFIAKFERNNVESATISWWHTGLPGRLGSLLTDKNEKGGGWWLYKWYGEMTGYMAMVTPPNDKSDKVDGFACVDRKRNQATLIVGGNTEGEVSVMFEKLPEFFNGRVVVKLERVKWESKDKPVASTDLLYEKEVLISGSTLNLSLDLESKLYAYRLTLTPVDVPQTPFHGEPARIPGMIQAENYDVAGQGFSYHDNDETDKGATGYRDDWVDIVTAEDGYALGYTEKGEWLEYTIDVQETNDYDVFAYVSNGFEVEGFRLYLGDTLLTEPYTIAKICDDWSQYEEVRVGTIHLSEGTHVLKLYIPASYINIDWIKFEVSDPSCLRDLVDYKEVEMSEDVLIFDMEGHQMSLGNLQSNRVYIAIIDGKKVRFMKAGSK